MAIDTRQKRMSTVMVALPFRGPMVDPIESGFNVGNRQASIYQSSVIETTVVEADGLTQLIFLTGEL